MSSVLQETLQDSPYRVEQTPAERFKRYRFTLYHDSETVGRGTHFSGSRHIQPWIELQPTVPFTPEQDEHRELFDALTTVLEPGSHLMVHYLQDDATAETITANVPPPATPLGFLMWQAGIRWYKDWYFTEGWMEGDQKLQGNLPINEETRIEREQEWETRLQAFIDQDTTHQECIDRARTLISSL